MQVSPSHLDRADFAVLALLGVLAVFVGYTVVHAPSAVGEYRDDGIYLATGKSLSDGHGYHQPHLPGQPGQTKYPILYPLLLAALWRWFPDVPAMVAPLQIANTVLWAAASWAAYLLMRRAWRLPWPLPACGACLAFAHTGTLGLLQTAMSEPLYLLCSMACLLWLEWSRGAGRPGSKRDRFVLSGWGPAVLAGAAYLTRVIGVSAMLAVICELIARKRWRHVAAAAIVCAATLAGWQAWRRHAAEVNSHNPVAVALAYDLDYSVWAPRSIAALERVALYNLPAMAAEFTDLLLPAHMRDTEAVLQGRAPGLLLLHGVFLLVAGLTLAGAAAIWNRNALPLHVYLVGYLALVLIWPFPPLRFLLPVFPLLATCFLTGVYAALRGLAHLAAWVSASSPGSTAAAEPARGCAGGQKEAAWRLPLIGVVILAALLFYPGVQLIARQPGRAQFQADADAREALIELLRARTAPDAIICCELPAMVYLRTGRTAVPFVPWTDPLPFIYPADRELAACGRDDTPGAVRNVSNHVKRELLEYLRATGATHVVPPDEATTQGMAFNELRLSHPAFFRLIETVRGVSLYRIEAPARRYSGKT